MNANVLLVLLLNLHWTVGNEQQPLLTTTTSEPSPLPTTSAVGTSALPTVAVDAADPESSCSSVCAKTYPLHTYPKADHLLACHRGCRFFTLIHLVSDGQPANITRSSCLSVCAEAYNDTDHSYPCSIGCNNQVPSSLHLPAEEDEDNEEAPSPFFTSPFSMLRSLLDNIMSRGSFLVQRSSMAFYLTRNSDTGESRMVIVQSEPEVVVHQYQPDLIQNQQPQSVFDIDSGANEERTTNDYPQNSPAIDLSLWTNDNPLLAHSSNRINEYDVRRPAEKDNQPWITCFGYQSGVPRWILVTVLFLAIFVLAWICCTTISTAPEQHIKQRRFATGSDLQYLRLFEDQPAKLIINEKPPTYEELAEAGPLPAKEPLQLAVDQLESKKPDDNKTSDN